LVVVFCFVVLVVFCYSILIICCCFLRFESKLERQ